MPETPNQQTEHREETTLSRQLDTLLSNSLSYVTQVTQGTVSAMKEVSKLARGGPVIVPLVLGPVMIFLALALRLELVEQGLGNLSSSEFITVVLTGAMLVVLGGLIHLYQYRTSHELRRRIQDTAERALDAQIQAYDKVIESELQRQQEADDEQVAQQGQQWFHPIVERLKRSLCGTKAGTSRGAE